MPDLPARLLSLSPRIRYAALYLDGRLDMHSASGLRAMTSEEWVAAEPGLPLDDLFRRVRQVPAKSGMAGRAA